MFTALKLADVVVVGGGEVTGLLPTGSALLSVTVGVGLAEVVATVLVIKVALGF